MASHWYASLEKTLKECPEGNWPVYFRRFRVFSSRLFFTSAQRTNRTDTLQDGRVTVAQ